jgi:hypothetical protein
MLVTHSCLLQASLSVVLPCCRVRGLSVML